MDNGETRSAPAPHGARTVLIIFTLILQTNIIDEMSMGGEEESTVRS